MLAVALGSMVKVVRFESGPQRGHFLQIDEAYFSICAARSAAIGHMLPAGCHDQKTPLVMLVHQWVQDASEPYDTHAVKVAAFGLVGLVVAASGVLAGVIGGPLAAVATSGVLLQAFATFPSFMALKTETVGTLFLMVGLLAWMRAARRPSIGWSLVSGALAGAAVLTKQTYVLAAMASLAWMVWLRPHGWRTLWRDLLAYVAGALLLLLLMLALFHGQDTVFEFLVSSAVYPTVYGVTEAASWWSLKRWRLAAVLDALATTPLLATLCAMALAGFMATARRTGHPGSALLLAVATSLAAIQFLSPVFFPYHLAALWPVMAVLGGVAVAQLSRHVAGTGQAFLLAGLAMPAVLMGAQVWNARSSTGEGEERQYALRVPAPAGTYAFVLGMSPRFYTDNRFIPATSVLFPWALPGAPSNPLYQRAEGDGPKANLLRQVQAKALERLWQDFGRTPPRYIAIQHEHARSVQSSAHVSDVPGFDDYLKAHCSVEQERAADSSGPATIYRCSVP